MKKTASAGFMLLILITASLFTAGTVNAAAQTFVDCHGQLKVQGNRIVDAYNQPITLRGMSMYAWASQGLQYYNATAVARLINEWKCTVIRIPILPANVATQENLVKTVVDACIANGVYAIIDWHSMEGANATACSDFMKRMATLYGNTPNVMYETWNEPVNESWATVKAYHQQVITAIRAIDPDNIIFCGNPQWDQTPQQAANDRITTSTNIAYVMHFYAASHGQWLRDNTLAALNSGVAIFATEYGTGTADGNGTMDAAATQTWWNFMDANGVGSANWSVSALGETTAAFNPGASATNWTDADLKPSGALVKNYLIQKNTALFDACNVASPVPTSTRTCTPTPASTFTRTATRTMTMTATRTRTTGPSPSNTMTSSITQTRTFSPTITPTIAPSSVAAACGAGIVIDGNLSDAAWQTGAWGTNSRLVTGTNPQGASAQFKVRWDAANLYVAVDVTDSTPFNDSVATWYDDSSVEVYLDMNHNKSAAYQADDFQFSMRYNDPLIREQGGKQGTAAGATAIRPGGYIVEMRLPWTVLGVTPAAAAVYGLDIGVNVDSGGGVREGVLMWAGTGNNYADTSAFGETVLGAACAVSTPTFTASRTATITFTRTATATATRSVTPVNTATSTPANTFTNTPVNTATHTRTVTETNTPVNTPSNTPSWTSTITRTATFTNTPTKTVTPTFTISRTHSVSPTITETVTGTPPTATATETITESHTVSPTATSTGTATVTPTDTPVDTETVTQTITATSTEPAVPSETATPTETFTNTPESTATNTPVDTGTETPADTSTNTPVNTATWTHTVTFTRTIMPSPTVTITQTTAISPTNTPTSVTVSDKFEIKNLVVFPNPFNFAAGSSIYLRCDFTQDASFVRIKIYTAGFRAVKEIIVPGTIPAGRMDLMIFASDLRALSRGVYYCVVTGRNGNNQKAKTQPEKLVVLR